MKEIVLKLDSSDLSEELVQKINSFSSALQIVESKLDLILTRIDKITIPLTQTPVPELPPIIEEPVIIGGGSFEIFGADPFYKEFNGTISILGKKVIADSPVFNSEYLGKSFCGINSHKNPNEVNFDYYYPALITSRYAKVTRIVSPTELELDFSFNIDSKKGYFFFDNSEAFTKAVTSGNPLVTLTKGRTYVIPEYKINIVNNSLKIRGENSTLLIGYESYFQWAKEKKISQPDHLIYSDKNIDIVFDCNVISPYTTVHEAWPFNRDLFRNPSNNQTQIAVFALINSEQPKLSPFGTECKGWGFGFTYSGKDIYNVVKNVKTSTNNFIQPKSNYAEGNNTMVLLDSEFIQNNAEINADRVKCEGVIDSDGVFTITSDNNIYQIYNIFMVPDQWSNRGQILHIGRFSFPLQTRNILSPTKIKLDIPKDGMVYNDVHFYQGGLIAELNAGDVIEIEGAQYTVLSKDRALHPYFETNNYPSSCVLDKPLVEGNRYSFKVIKSTAIEIFNKQQPCWMIYKVNKFWTSTLDTKFGDESILWSPTGTNAVFYPHVQVNIWAKNIVLDGYYRVSSGQGVQKFCNLINVKNISSPDSLYFGNEFGAQVPITTDMSMPERVLGLV